jgi:serine/threonine protein kinase/Flp pilus assembly protein TadD
MQAQESAAAICPGCGTRLAGGFSPGLGRCMICLLRVGFADGDEPSAHAETGSRASDRLGTYRVTRHEDGALWELGRGAMGVTYRAVDTSLQRPVALKLIDPEWIKRGAEARARFAREARTAAALRHPNVATVYQFGVDEENGQYFCAMELVEGETLETRIRRTGPVDALTVVEIALQVASALAAAEEQGLVHRDLKPGNLMLASAASAAAASDARLVEQADTVVKMIDFGVAKALAEEPDAMRLTQGGFVGTPAFASPEQFNDEPVDVRSDVFSLGATLWYALTGQLPFPGGTIEQIRDGQRARTLPLHQLRAARVPDCLVSVLVGMLAAEPAARPGIRELTRRLQRCRAKLLDRWKTARRIAVAAAIVTLASVAAIPLVRRSQRDAATSSAALPVQIPPKSIAVLPFENLSEDASNAYFAHGIQDQILTKLAGVADLKVISRTSTEKYKSRSENLKTVGQQLSVATIVEGSVQKVGDRVLVNVQLIDARSDSHLWAKAYDRELRDVFGVQNEISQEIADALRAQLSPREAERLADVPTRDAEAYDSFLKGEYEDRQGDSVPTFEAFERAAAHYRGALERDPQFALAAARFARSRLLRHWLVTPLSAVELAEVRSNVDQALALAPNLAESHLSLGLFHYHAHRRYDEALTAFRRALELQPNNANARFYSGLVYRRQGAWEQSLAEMAKAAELDPRAPSIPANIAATYVNLRRWSDAKRAASRALTLDPRNNVGLRASFQSCINGDGDTNAARRSLGPLPDGVRLATYAVRGSVSSLIEDAVYLPVLERNFEAALNQSIRETSAPMDRMTSLAARTAIRVLSG